LGGQGEPKPGDIRGVIRQEKGRGEKGQVWGGSVPRNLAGRGRVNPKRSGREFGGKRYRREGRMVVKAQQKCTEEAGTR